MHLRIEHSNPVRFLGFQLQKTGTVNWTQLELQLHNWLCFILVRFLLKSNAWNQYQKQTADFFRGLGLDADTDLTLMGVRTSHEIDVLVRSHHVGFDITWIVECKHWKKRVSKLHVLALREIVSDLGADRGIILCEVGFQRGAIEAANLTNVHISSLDSLRTSAKTDIFAMRLQELFDRNETCRRLYNDIPKKVRIELGLRPHSGGFGYSGFAVFNAVSDVLGFALRDHYPFAPQSIYGQVLFGFDHEFTAVQQVLAAVEPLIKGLEDRLATYHPQE